MAPALQLSARLPCVSPLAEPAPSSSSRKPLLLVRRPPLPPPSSRSAVVARAATLKANAQTRERQRLKEQFEAAHQRCCTAPMEGVSFTLEDFLNALDKYDFDPGVGAKVKGTVYSTDMHGALVDITAKSPAHLPVQEACICKVKHVADAGIFPGFQDEFIIIGKNAADDSLVLSLRSVQYALAWERCRQLQIEDVLVKGKVTGGNKGGIMVIVEGLHGFVPFSQISMESRVTELHGKELPLKFVEIDEEQSRLVLSNRKAMTDSLAQLGIGSVVTGTVQSLKPYGVLVDIGGLTGLLHLSQISHGHVSDISSVVQSGDVLKVMILSHDRANGRVSLSTKKLEPTPGDMIRNPKLVFDKADEMAHIFRQRIAQVQEIAHAEMVRFQSENELSPSSDVIFSTPPDLSVDALHSTDTSSAVEL